MKKLKTIIIDDEFPALKQLQQHALASSNIEVIGAFGNSLEAKLAIAKYQPELILSDIQMPALNGIDLIQQIPSNCMVVFFTGNPAFALRAFDFKVIDYVVKPYTAERFNKAIQKVLDLYGLSDLQTPNNFIQFKSDFITHQLLPQEIKYVEGYGEYIKIHTLNKCYLVLSRLNEFEEKNKDKGFIRIHKSYIVQKQKIVSYAHQMAKLSDGSELPVGRIFKNNINQ